MAYTILVPVEDTTWTPGFISHLNQLARQDEACFVLLRVLPDLTGINGMETEQQLLEAEGMLQDCGRQLDIGEEHVRYSVEMGKPEIVIPQRAAVERADLVAMTTHARRGVRRILEGSVAEAVMRVSPCPTLLCHTDVTPHPVTRGREVVRVLVPLDTAASSTETVNTLTRLVPVTNHEIVLYHAFTGSSEADASGSSVEQEKARVAACKQALLDHGYRVSDICSSYRNPAHEIINKIDEFDIDLVTMATHGRQGLSRMLFGSVAESVLHHSAVPLLTVSTAPTQAAAYQERYIG